MSIKIDDITGLPALPEGKIWLVEFVSSDYWDRENPHGYLRVTIRHKGWFKNWNRGSIAMLSAALTEEDGTPVAFERYPELVLWVAEKVMDKYGAALTKELWLAKQEVVTRELNGLYPPKKLVLND